MRKNCHHTETEPAAFGLLIHCRFDSCGKKIFSHCLFLSSRCSGGSSLGFRAGSLQVRSTQKRLNIKTLARKHQKHHIVIDLLLKDVYCWCPTRQTYFYNVLARFLKCSFDWGSASHNGRFSIKTTFGNLKDTIKKSPINYFDYCTNTILSNCQCG